MGNYEIGGERKLGIKDDTKIDQKNAAIIYWDAENLGGSFGEGRGNKEFGLLHYILRTLNDFCSSANG